MIIVAFIKQYWNILQNDTNERILLLILVLSLSLRMWGIWNIEQTDEYNEVFEALKIDSGYLNYERWNKKVLVYILAVEYALYFGAGWLTGIFVSISDFASKIVIDMTPLFIIGRATSAIFGTAIVFVTYLIGKNLFDKKAGLVAASFLCFNLVHVEHSHLVLVDITMTLLLMLSFYFATCIMYEGKYRSYILAGIFAGLAIVAKIPSIFILISVGVAHVLYVRQYYVNKNNIVYNKSLIYLLFGLISGAILGNPAVLFALPKYLDWLKLLFGAYQGTADSVYYWTPLNGFIFYFISLIRNMGLPLLGLTIIGLLYFTVKSRKEILLLLSFVLPFFIFMAYSKWVLADRYMIPAFPFLSIIAGAVLLKIQEQFRIGRFLIIIMIGALLIIPIKNVVLFEISLLHQNTRYLAKDWIEYNIPSGSKILIDAGRTINTQSPPLINTKENIIAIIDKIENLQEGKTYDDSRIVDSKSAIYYKYLLENMPAITYDLNSTELGTNIKSVGYYRENGYNYIITSSDITWRIDNRKWAETFPESAVFYKSLSNEYIEIKKFEASMTRRGPTITIYKVS
jgi:4-amino-4-deoxy-L-arabinose transferase-like glycosyltransferase